MAPRTRACERCRQMRIKCDANLPCCNQCIRAYRKRPRSCSRASHHGHDVPNSIVNALKAMRLSEAKKATHSDEFGGSSCSLSRHKRLSTPKPSTQVSWIISQRQDEEAGNGPTWMYNVPELSSGGTNMALSLAIRAPQLLLFAASNLRILALLRQSLLVLW
ncbi:hypothetical protein K432DRAFT_386411 [Lepidopterella palustris CBS 459.81]|uniref:Zn(2)-C6 fungal-type domain-containing protein n=1 Tax=Lepidopterella palustris CBS 459.81 TaxID=1314670 RepID=A0A8E2JA68_9PEZI|nr:hypothetical protein K432DRAFT_386411 [Lepidopterella palustris CBS 459.81]